MLFPTFFNYFKSFRNDLKFFSHKTFTFIAKFIPKYVIFGVGIADGYFLSFIFWLLFVYMKTLHFCLFILHPTILLNALLAFRFLVFSHRIFKYTTISSANRNKAPL